MKAEIRSVEPVYLVPDGPAHLTEYGKRWLDERMRTLDRFSASIRDACKLAILDEPEIAWPQIDHALAESGVPVAVTSGLAKYSMAKLIDHANGKTSFTMPTTVALALATTAPTSASTGATVVEATYTGYARVSIAAAGFNAATAADPSVATNNGAVTFNACTGSTSTLLGFMLADSATTGAGNALWYGTLTSTVISTTQTPATVADTAMSLSLTGT